MLRMLLPSYRVFGQGKTQKGGPIGQNTTSYARSVEFLRVGGRLSLPYESLAGLQNFCHQFGRCGFHVAAQHPLGTGGAKQYPSVRAVTGLGSIEIEFHAVAILFSQD